MNATVPRNIVIGEAEEYKWILDPHMRTVYMTDGEQRVVFEMPYTVFKELSSSIFKEL